MDPEGAGASGAHVAKVREALSPWSATRRYLNFVERAGARGALVRRGGRSRGCTEVKGRYDPDGLFRANHEVAVAV